MKLFNIQNTKEFFEQVLHCDGEVHVLEVDGSERDLKAMAGYMIDEGLAERMAGIPEINLTIQKSSDANYLLGYAMGMGRERICA